MLRATPITERSPLPQEENSAGRCGRRILLAICGGVGAVMMPLFSVYLRKRGIASINVMLSRAATQFVTPQAMRLHAGGRVYTDACEGDDVVRVPHIDLPRAADLLLVIPATANVIAKAAHGICDDLITTAIVAAPCRVAFAPSMNGGMWLSRTVQRNVALLRELGHSVIEPGPGFEIADLEPTFGCLRPLEQLAAEVEVLLHAERHEGATAMGQRVGHGA